MIDLRTVEWFCHFHDTLTKGEGEKVDMYILTNMAEDGGGISLGVPHGRDDIARFIVASCEAGQKMMQADPSLTVDQFAPAKGFKKG